jgi:transcriptional regulator with XRE-family HTH domain
MTSTPELVKHRFSEELRRCCGSHYPSIPSNEQFARDLYLSSKYSLKVSRETVRKWFKGDSFPDLDHLLHLIQWLGLDMSKVFVKDFSSDMSVAAGMHIGASPAAFIDEVTPEQIDSFVHLLNTIKNSDLVKSRRRY